MTSSSSTPVGLGSSELTVLYQAAQNRAALTQQTQLLEISQDLQRQLNRQLAALQNPVDQVSVDYSQAQIKNLEAQQKTVSGLETVFGNNGSILTDMTSQLSLMVQAINKGDGTSFDNELSALNTDLADLTPPASDPLFQQDGIAALKTNGFTIQSSASYPLSTPSGQAAAMTDVTNAQAKVKNILTINGGNQTLAASELTALDGQINALQTLQNQQQDANSQATAQETARLQKNMQNQLHLIELNMGKTSQVSDMLNAVLHPPRPQSSVFGALSNSVGENASTAETQLGQTPILSLFA